MHSSVQKPNSQSAHVSAMTRLNAKNLSTNARNAQNFGKTPPPRHVFARGCGLAAASTVQRDVCNMKRTICRIVTARPATRTFRAPRAPVTTAHQSTPLLSPARAWSRSLTSRSLSTSGNDDADADARATDDYAPADAAANVVDEDAPAPLLTPKQRGISKKAPPLSEKQKKKLAAQWADYVEYMDHQRTQGWKT